MPTLSGCAVGSGGVVAASAANEAASASQTSAARAVHVLFMVVLLPGGWDAITHLVVRESKGSGSASGGLPPVRNHMFQGCAVRPQMQGLSSRYFFLIKSWNAPATASTAPPIKVHIALSVGEPLNTRLTLESNACDMLYPQISK